MGVVGGRKGRGGKKSHVGQRRRGGLGESAVWKTGRGKKGTINVPCQLWERKSRDVKCGEVWTEGERGSDRAEVEGEVGKSERNRENKAGWEWYVCGGERVEYRVWSVESRV
jgi:hypothetical protein